MGTLSGAGRELRLSQPAVSLQMKELGAEVRVELFRMRGKRLELTQAGEELVRYAERILGLAIVHRDSLESVISVKSSADRRREIAARMQ